MIAATRGLRSLLSLWIIFQLNSPTFAQFKNGLVFKTAACEGKNGGLFPMIGTCQAYFVCNEGKAVVGTCEVGTRFNPESLQCDAADKVSCPFEILDAVQQQQQESNDSDNSDESDDYSEEDSEEYIEPTTSTTTVKPFVTTKKPKPLIRPSKDLELETSLDNMCMGKRNNYVLSKEGSCTEYYVCKSRQPHVRRCPGQKHFSPKRRVCMKPEEAKCLLVTPEIVHQESPPIIGGFCSDEKQNALVPHQKDCGKFLLCSNMMFLVMDCPMGLHFNAELKRCDYPKVAQCEVQKIKETMRDSKKMKLKSKPKTNLL